ncbi:MAG TPA: hypothetical protein VN515_00605 [Terriglobales bacterium]|nr:hypothetical protein [Terriglobales bacterium]
MTTRIRATILREEKRRRATAPVPSRGKKYPGPGDEDRPFTEAEWNYFIVLRDVLRRDGEAAARDYLAQNPRPAEIPDWILLRECDHENPVLGFDPGGAELLAQARRRNPDYVPQPPLWLKPRDPIPPAPH